MKWETFGFANPQLLFLLLLVPLLAAIRSARGAAPAVVYSSLSALRGLGRPRRSKMGGATFGLLLLSFIVLILALARPQQGRTLTHVEASGIDIMLAIDVSRSMLAEDFTIGRERANRLEAVKQVTEKFIQARPNDRIGIVAFAGQPYLVSPLTLDHDWLLQNLERVRIGLVEDGTAIGSAIASAGNRLKDKEAKSGDTQDAGLKLLDVRSLADFVGGSDRVMEARLTAAADSVEELKQRAASLLREAGWFVKCEGETDLARLNAVLRVGKVVQVNGAGRLHSGTYFVWIVRHTITADDHRMRFVLVRNAVGAP